MTRLTNEIRDMEDRNTSESVIHLTLARHGDDIAEDMGGLKDELKAIRRVLTGILISIVVAMVGIPIAVIWQLAFNSGN